jgi:hypothetical protein
LSYEHGDSY